MQFTGLVGQVISTPVVENESPFHLGFDVKIKGDVLHAVFVGNNARSLRNSIRFGDYVSMNGNIDKGTLVVGYILMQTHAAIGRNLNVLG